MLLLSNQFNKKTDFLIISITWLWLFLNLILCSFDLFEKGTFDFISIKSIVFFFLATILAMAMFNFQFWIRIKIGSWYFLTCCTSLLFSHYLMLLNKSNCFFFNVLNKSNCFKTVKLHVFQLTVIFFSFDCHLRFNIVLFQFIILLIKLDRKFFCIYYHHLLDPK